ncbi:MAG TPA: hypothetical protein VGP31_02010 [Planosporangium sp.]|jgi:3-mercaptopyruvate sulfurtransferase SseA|nr:hypothetical protein [Planosporangium sp.]
MTHRQHLVDVAGLIGELARTDPPTVLDVRWTPTGGRRAAYDAGHLPGAVFLDLDADAGVTSGRKLPLFPRGAPRYACGREEGRPPQEGAPPQQKGSAP